MIVLRDMLKRGFLAALLSLAWVGGTWSPCMAGELGLEWVAIRGGMSGGSPFGEEQQVYFQQLDLAAKFRLPWEKEIGSDWVFGSKMLGSAGVLMVLMNRTPLSRSSRFRFHSRGKTIFVETSEAEGLY
jgi:hypothetical protein